MSWFDRNKTDNPMDLVNAVFSARTGAEVDLTPREDPTVSAIKAQTEAVKEQTSLARETAAAALRAQQEATALAQASAMPTRDSESARAAADNERRRRMRGSNFNIGLPNQTGAPPVGFRLLAGQ